MTEHITAVTQMVSNEPSMLYPTVNNVDDEINQSDGDDVVSSQSESDDDNDPEEGELQPLVNLVNPLGMRFDDKVQAISAVRKWSISVHKNLSTKSTSISISHLVANDNEIHVSSIIQKVQLRKIANIYIAFFLMFLQCVEKMVNSRHLCAGDIFATNVQKNLPSEFSLVLSENFWRDVPFNLIFYPPNMKNERDMKQSKRFQGTWIIEIRILPQDVADVACRNIIEKIIITPDQTM
ncbi:hypothetical protein M9H77_24321 [Catharanthus roseus]|uniref:Uncharacterized protein n=1 Tax=Catharanthus roseus TaxID=4058 RepID=A0ACC0AYJ1_CATRO|nr:hypothetical protein M9H77_24321 [Catharanthus roseus]